MGKGRKPPPRREPEDEAASLEEVRQAIVGLTPAELLRLQGYARWRVRGVGRAALGRAEHDLLQDALISTLAGDRKWKKAAVDLVGHLTAVMRSISSHWKTEFDPAEPRLETELAMASADGE